MNKRICKKLRQRCGYKKYINYHTEVCYYDSKYHTLMPKVRPLSIKDIKDLRSHRKIKPIFDCTHRLPNGDLAGNVDEIIKTGHGEYICPICRKLIVVMPFNSRYYTNLFSENLEVE